MMYKFSVRYVNNIRKIPVNNGISYFFFLLHPNKEEVID